MIRSVVVFAHLIGMVTLFVGLALESLSVEVIGRAASRDEVASWLRVSAVLPRLAGLAVALVVTSGVYLGVTLGVLTDAWMRASYAALVLMGMLGGLVVMPRLRAIHAAAAREETTVVALQTSMSDAVLRSALAVRVVFGLAVVYLMVDEPGAAASLIVMTVALLVSGVIFVTHRRRPKPFAW